MRSEVLTDEFAGCSSFVESTDDEEVEVMAGEASGLADDVDNGDVVERSSVEVVAEVLTDDPDELDPVADDTEIEEGGAMDDDADELAGGSDNGGMPSAVAEAFADEVAGFDPVVTCETEDTDGDADGLTDGVDTGVDDALVDTGVVVAAAVIVVVVAEVLPDELDELDPDADDPEAGEVLAATGDTAGLADGDANGDVFAAEDVVVAFGLLAGATGDKTGEGKLTDELARCGDKEVLFSPAVFFNCSILLEKNCAVSIQVFMAFASANHCAFCGQPILSHSDVNSICC